jgi:hypothetical protein
MLMKVIHRIAGLVVVITVTAAGLLLLSGAWSGDRWSELLGLIMGNRSLAAGIGVALLCLVAIYILSAVPRRKHQQYLSFDGDGGTVSISTAAIAEYVARIAGEFPAIVKMKPEVIPARNTIDIHAYIQIKDGPEMHEVCELMQKRIREVLAGNLGINDVRRVEISVREIIAQLGPE